LQQYHVDMGLVRAWTRQLCGASAAVLVVPGALGGALAVLAVAGSFGGLGSIGQALSGPALPAVDRAASRTASASLAGALHSVSTSTLAARPALLTPGTSRSAAKPGPGSGPSPLASRPGGGGLGIQGQSGFAGGVGTASPPASGAPSAPPKQPPPAGVLDAALKAASPVTSQLPGPASNAAGQALQSVSSTAHKLLPSAR